MKFVTVRDFRTSSANIWKTLPQEQEMVISNNGKPIALLIPLSNTTLEETLSVVRRAKAINAVKLIQQQSIQNGTDKVTLDEINNEIEMSRKTRKNSNGERISGNWRLHMRMEKIMLLLFISMTVGAAANDIMPSPQQLKRLAETLPPYESNLDCGFEAIRVFEEFGGELVIAQQTGIDFVPDGIYKIKRTVIPSDMYELLSGILQKGWYIWYGKIYLSYPQYGFYEVSLKRQVDIQTHRSVNMQKNGAHVWNIINNVVIDISWARQHLDTFLETVIVEGETY
jgi:antitoxin (DNA-binding transcriptional repressor) of toxin-antitoxin stability system